ncbi:hypothetical protein [Myxosarcina sp. GI1]|uniref:hypothetical protein n=1 Tax=Myxosarcina sp. GI1 TaxID=1541065 RepID=UPI00155ACAAC|nr:hypothetical protein [Myxosarcina sp. GI1]
MEINRIFHNLILPTLQIDEEIASCQESIVHPNTQTREQALERPKEWMSEIPNLSGTDKGASRYVAAEKKLPKNAFKLEEDLEPTPVDPPDNQFVWFAFFLVIIILGSLVWLAGV